MSEFSEGHLGAKSNNIKTLYEMVKTTKSADFINLPESVAVPFTTCEQVLSENKAAEGKLTALFSQISKCKSSKQLAKLLEKCKSIIMGLDFGSWKGFKEIVKGLPLSLDEGKVSHGIKQVWASKYNERAFLAT
jgi:alpha-glucan,water dikinase